MTWEKPTMGRPKSLIEMFQQSVRLPASLIPWLKGEAKTAGSFSAVIKALIEDAMNLYELPPNQKARLEAEAKRLGMKRRDYVRYVLSIHAEQLATQPTTRGPRTSRR
jgi:hypothetical protein